MQRHVLAGTEWAVPDYYSDLVPIGAGAFGSVCSAIDSRMEGDDEEEGGQRVAVKKLQGWDQGSEVAKRTYREIQVMKFLGSHDNVIGMSDLFTSVGEDGGTDLYIGMELMETDLNQVLLSQALDADQIKYVVYQILCALKFVHSAGIIHRDLKAGNLATNSELDIKVIDFGLETLSSLARSSTGGNDAGSMTSYVVTRFYRAPELVCASGQTRSYDYAIDMWSVGCILAEMLDTAQVLFEGSDALSQLLVITEKVGTPSEAYITSLAPEDQALLRSIPHSSGKSFSELFPKASPECCELLAQLLKFDPKERVTAADALLHPYFADIYDEEDAPLAEEMFNQEFEDDHVETEIWRRRVLDTVEEVRAFLDGVEDSDID